jgi:Uma2 family endonuclease
MSRSIGSASWWRAIRASSSRGPDVAFVTTRRADEQCQNVRAFEGAPDLAVEILSPSDAPAEVRIKVAEYLAAGTRLVWVVDPESKTVTVYSSLFAPRVVGEGDLLDGEDVVPGFSVLVREIFEP